MSSEPVLTTTPTKEEAKKKTKEVTLLCVYGNKKPNEKIKLPKKIAEELISIGWAK